MFSTKLSMFADSQSMLNTFEAYTKWHLFLRPLLPCSGTWELQPLEASARPAGCLEDSTVL